MDTPILINQVVHSTEENRDYRILWNGTPGFWICLNSKENIPREFSMEKLLEGIQSGLYTLVPDLWMASPGVQAPSASSIRRRDRVWALIGDIVTKEPAIYDQEQRKTLLKEKSVSSGVAVSNLYPHLGRYWRGGKVPDTLLGNYQTCGKCRDPYKENATRLGRKKKAGAAGKTLTVRDLQYFREAICAYHLNGDKLSLEKTYKKLIGDHYTVKDKAGKSVAQMDPDDIPSRQQFFYWYRTNKDVLEEAKSRDGERSYNLNNRAELGKTETHLYGPGMATQIDATTADIYLVSRDDRTAIIGRPTMYFLMDSYSHIVTGMNISLDPPSWDNAARTILNAIENKVDFCKRYGIDISEEEWPCQNIPSMILGDRGEMESRTADLLVKNLGITVENAPPYRGDLKGIIEKHFDLINIDMASLPGKVKKDFGERCTEDYRLNASLDIFQFTAIIIRCVIQYNNYHYMKDYRKTPQMRQLHIKPVPRDLWNYGIRYMSGGLRAMDRGYVRYHLLPKGEASITKRGIQFEGRYYSCEQAEQEKWFDVARTQHSWKVTCAYDPRDAALIYVSPAANALPVECHLLERDWMYEGYAGDEASFVREKDSTEATVYAPTEDFHSVQLDEFIEDTKKEARRLAAGSSSKSKAARIAEIQTNRKREKETIREVNTEATLAERGIHPGKDDEKPEEEISPIQKMINDALDQRLKEGGLKP